MPTKTAKAATKNRHETPYDTDGYVIDLVADGYTTGLNPVIDIPVGFALTGGNYVVEDAVTGATSLQFRVGSDNMSGAVPVANLAVNDVGSFSTGAATATTTVASYAKSAALTLDINIVGTVTAGKILLLPTFVRVDSAILNPR